jgi:SAM-dependent methyltransferase
MSSGQSEGAANRKRVLELMRGYRQAQVLIACAELGVFATLADGGRTAGEVAATLEAGPHSLARLLNAAVSLGLLEQSGGRYTNSALAADCLAREGPFYLGNLVGREGAFYRRWANLGEAVRTGRRPEESRRDERQGNWVRDFELALYDVARTAAPAIAEVLAPIVDKLTTTDVRAIDIGGGHGAYSFALAERYPRLAATIFELPAAAEVARELAAATPAAARVHVRSGDFKRDPLGEGFHIALLFGVLVSETAPDALALLRKIHTALVPGGWLVLRGTFLDSERTGPLEAVLADVHMLLSTDAGTLQTLAEVTGWLQTAGFSASLRIAVPGETSPLWAAQKPA